MFSRLVSGGFSPLRRAMSSVSHINPLLGVNVAAKFPVARAAPAPKAQKRDWAIAHFRQLPVSHKKLRVVANLVPGLYVREAMLQLEFCRKNMAVFVKNAIDSAVNNAVQRYALDRNRLVVETAVVTKGSMNKGIIYKSKGRAGRKKMRKSHLRVCVRQVTVEELTKTRFYSRWRQAAKMLAVPWEERVKDLPRYQPVPGYEPGERRIPLMPVTPRGG